MLSLQLPTTNWMTKRMGGQALGKRTHKHTRTACWAFGFQSSVRIPGQNLLEFFVRIPSCSSSGAFGFRGQYCISFHLSDKWISFRASTPGIVQFKAFYVLISRRFAGSHWYSEERVSSISRLNKLCSDKRWSEGRMFYRNVGSQSINVRPAKSQKTLIRNKLEALNNLQNNTAQFLVLSSRNSTSTYSALGTVWWWRCVATVSQLVFSLCTLRTPAE